MAAGRNRLNLRLKDSLNKKRPMNYKYTSLHNISVRCDTFPPRNSPRQF